ncbi:hypothetical protein QQS21_007083 [Conoideocrella luteorostrata]|uniref:Uncharacterized protein n=1 Tax=Conoideocrella luteorostrata TaxID=1105319 RepID=A0AAJ0CLE1_9HYPO|nr:hypothetical protein QQS21_007083 [Conoideocrella luteorostrata]
MADSASHTPVNSQIFQTCATAIAQSQTQNQQLRIYADSQKREAESNKQDASLLRSEIQQLRNVIFYLERERDQEVNKCSILQQLVETQRRIIRDYGQEQQGQMSSGHLPGPIDYGSNIHQAFAHVPATQRENAVITGPVDEDSRSLG